MKLFHSIPALFAMAATLARSMEIPGDLPKELGSLTSEGSTLTACHRLVLEYDPKDLVDQRNAVGKTQRVPLTGNGGSTTGEFLLEITDIFVGTGQDRVNHCLFSGSINLDPTESGTPLFGNQIVIQGTCVARGNPVIGGSGEYLGIFGRQFFAEGNTEGMIAVVVDYCDS